MHKENARRRKEEADRRRVEDELQEKKERETKAALEAWAARKTTKGKQGTESLTPIVEARMIWSPAGIGDGGPLRRSPSPY